MPATMEAKPKRARILGWRGVVGDSSRKLRWMIAIALVVSGIVLAFTQLGFVNLSLPDGETGYVVVLLQVVALGALLLGTLAGVVMGLVVGGCLFLHSQILPLDHYELTFVTPVSSVVMFGAAGLLLGVLFAFALRNDPSQVKRVIYIVIVCVIVSILYSFGFVVNMIISLAAHLVESVGVEPDNPAVEQMARATAMQFGDLGVQLWGTGLLMAALCVVGDYLARRIRAHRGVMGLRTVFGSWLLVVVSLSFMGMAAVSFGVSTADALRDAEEDMHSKIDYLCDQMQMAGKRSELFEELFRQGGLDFEKVDESLAYDLSSLLEDSTVLDGYAPEDDGIVIFIIDNYLYASNDERFEGAYELEDAFTADAIEAIARSMETGRMERFVFGGIPASLVFGDEKAAPDNMAWQPTIAYVCAKHAYDVFDHSGSVPKKQNSVDVVMIRTSDQVFAKRPEVMTWLTLSCLVLLIVVFAIVSQLLNRVVARRIDEENATLELITAGSLDARAEAGGTREFESLSEGINVTVETLKGWIAEAETRMDAELATARAIQESALPRTFPPFPDILKFDVYASMNAAKEVGGDFYDFFLVGDDCQVDAGKLGFLVADVSGKGVPAALFMMKAKALLRDYVSSGMELGEAVSETNRQLVEGNDEDMFVTAWVGVLDYGTGRVDYVNAGHNPPLLWQREGGWRWMRQKSGPMLGLFELPYRAHTVECKAGDTFLLYTDGVTEAFDVNESLYGEDRLMAVAEENYRKHPRALLEAVKADVALYAEGAEQSDDITILALEVGVPPEVTATLDVPARLAELNRVNEFLHAELDRRLCPSRVQNQLDIAVEELFVNVCKYAYPDATTDNPGNVRIQRTYNADPPSITVDVIDEGVPFDPLAKPDAVTPGNIEDVPIGGLGILMAKKSTDEMRYERVDNTNVVSIVKKW